MSGLKCRPTLLVRERAHECQWNNTHKQTGDECNSDVTDILFTLE